MPVSEAVADNVGLLGATVPFSQTYISAFAPFEIKTTLYSVFILNCSSLITFSPLFTNESSKYLPLFETKLK